MLERDKLAAIAMVNWGGPSSARYVRFVFANGPVERLRGIGARVEKALA